MPDAASAPLDLYALGRWMDANGVPGAGAVPQLEAIGGGASNDVYSVERGDERMVLRRPPDTAPPDRDKAMLREYRVLRALRGTDVPHPEAIAVCEDPTVTGRPFYLMAHVDGWSPMAFPQWASPFDTDLEARRGLAFELVGGIARLASVHDWKERGLDGFGRPDDFHERQVDRWLAHLDQFRFRDIPGLDVAADWLRTHKPSRYEPGILHGDYQFANVLYAHGAPATLAAVIDWEMATIGDPLLDLGWVLMGWPDPDAEPTAGYVDMTGMPSRGEVLDHYESMSGRSVDEIDYYVILAGFKIAIVLEGGYARYVARPEGNDKMSEFGRVVLERAAAAADLSRRTTLGPGPARPTDR
jgi:aminoglycoside phosphotransferase (APT) family kinase protein